MKRITVVFLAALAVTVAAKEFPVTVQKGGAEIIKNGTGEQTLVSGSGAVASGDMLTLTDGQQVAVAVEKSCVVLLKGPANVTFTDNGDALTIALDDGQLLLNRKQPHEYTGFSLVSHGFMFVPMGTCAAVKTAPNTQPTAAVINGKVRMMAPSGEAVVVDEGNYGSMGSDGKLATGALSPRAVESLNEWLAEAPAIEGSEPAAAAPAPSPVVPRSGPSPQQTAAAPAPAPASSPVAPRNAPATATAAAPAPTANAGTEQTESDQSGQSADESAKTPAVQKIDKTPPPPSSSKWEVSAGTATIDDKQWTRIALGLDVPIWKFGIFFDVELFVDNEGRFSDKGWNFDDDWVDALSRKIRYIRFGQEGDPLFIKFGGLSSVTMGYGFLVDRFTNMLHYPDEKLLGLQFDLNDISPIGLSLQTLVADFKDFNNDGGLAAARLGFKPLKVTGIPILKGLTFSGSYARDFNQYAPARSWDFTLPDNKWDRDQDGITDSTYYQKYQEDPDLYRMVRIFNIEKNDFDTIIENRDQWASRKEEPFGLIGGDIGLPLIATSLVSLDLYGQAGLRDDGKHGWGIGAPGLALKVWRFWANVEYRRIEGRFQPGYFGTYYLDERLLRDPEISTKSDRLVSDTLNGVFGRLGFNISDVLLIEGSYQYMIGQTDDNKDQRFEACASLGDMLLQKIPKLNRAEIYYYKSRIGSEHDDFFEETPFMYYGIRAGIAISEGASLIWDARYGYKHDENGKLVSNNNISVQTAITF